MRFQVSIFCILLSIVAPLASGAQERVDVPSELWGEHMSIYAHRGAWTRDSSKVFIIPENSLAAVEQAALLGYAGVEMDVKYTKDKKLVIMHDAKLNRTTRLRHGYKKLTGPVKVSDLTLRELRRDYVHASSDPSQRRKIPTLKQMLKACRKHKLIPMLHSSIFESYEMAQKIMGDKWICFTRNLQMCKKAREISGCLILYSINGGTPEELAATLTEIGGPCGVSTMKYGLYTNEFIDKLTENGFHVQASVFPAEKEKEAINNGVTIVLTDNLRPSKK